MSIALESLADEHRFIYCQEPHKKWKQNFPLERRAQTDFLTSQISVLNMFLTWSEETQGLGDYSPRSSKQN
jgi:hypothetical protein